MQRATLATLAALILAAPAINPALAAQGELVSTASDQTGISLTIYNNGRALVKDKRRIDLPAGTSTLAFREVSARIRPETALLTGGPEILEQNFEYDLLSPESLLRKYVGREVQLVRQNPTTGEDLPPERAQVLSAGGGVVLKTEGRIETGIPGRLTYPDLPADLRDRPTLTLTLRNDAPGPREIELSYLTGGLSWQADYVAELAEDEKSLNFKGWVTLTNESGASYKNARLQLVAGKVNVVQTEAPVMMVKSRAAMPKAAGAANDMAEEAMFEYHLYTLERPTTALENQKKQVALLQADGVQSAKEYVLRGAEYYYHNAAANLGDRLDVAVELDLKNEREHGLGLPIPAGVVRVYKRDSRGFLQFVGEDRIDHTPDKETMRLRLGSAFDVTAARKQTGFKKLGGSTQYNYSFESSYELTLKNAKDTPVTVKVLEPIPGDWEITRASAKHEKPAAHAAQ